MTPALYNFAMLAADADDLKPWYILVGCIFAVIMAILAMAQEKQREERRFNCDVCGLPIKRTFYTWTIEGKEQRLCPRCNSRMKNKVSKDAFKSKFG